MIMVIERKLDGLTYRFAPNEYSEKVWLSFTDADLECAVANATIEDVEKMIRDLGLMINKTVELKEI